MFIRILALIHASIDRVILRLCAKVVLFSFVLSQLGDCACHKMAVTSFAFLKYSLLVNFGA